MVHSVWNENCCLHRQQFFCCLKLEMKHGYDSVLWEQQEPGSRIVENRKEKM